MDAARETKNVCPFAAAALAWLDGGRVAVGNIHSRPQKESTMSTQSTLTTLDNAEAVLEPLDEQLGAAVSGDECIIEFPFVLYLP